MKLVNTLLTFLAPLALVRQAMADGCTTATGCTSCLDGLTDCYQYPMFTSPEATYFGYDNGYRFGNSFKIGLSTNQATANFVMNVSYSINAGSSFTPYGTITVTRPPGTIDDYTFGPYVNLNFTTIAPIGTNFILKIHNLPNSLMGTVDGPDPLPRIQILLDAYVGQNGDLPRVQQTNTRYSITDATSAPTPVPTTAPPCPEPIDIDESPIGGGCRQVGSTVVGRVAVPKDTTTPPRTYGVKIVLPPGTTYKKATVFPNNPRVNPVVQGRNVTWYPLTTSSKRTFNVKVKTAGKGTIVTQGFSFSTFQIVGGNTCSSVAKNTTCKSKHSKSSKSIKTKSPSKSKL